MTMFASKDAAVVFAPLRIFHSCTITAKKTAVLCSLIDSLLDRPIQSTMTESQQYACLRLLLDNGGAIERHEGEPGRYLSFAQRIALGQLSAQQQSTQVEEMSSVYRRLSENVPPQPKRAATAQVRSTPNIAH